MEVWEKVFLEDAEFMQSTHGEAGCTSCHHGNSAADVKEAAHSGLLADPSEQSCSACHDDIVNRNTTSLHTTTNGFATRIEARGGDLSEGSLLAAALDNHCNTCHTSCGQCHVSRPDEMGGGLVASHEFKKTPSMQYNCVACHGSRIGDEYLGNSEGVPGDVHWTQLGMTCVKCHGEELHGTGEVIDNRYGNSASPNCENCHQEVLLSTSGNPQHQQHISVLSCQSCHSVPYKNCYGCHVGLDDKGLPYRTLEASEISFKIGLNPEVSSERPHEYVVLRHVPASPTTWDAYGADLWPNFEAVPTWKYATPHNIQLHTPQNATCNACHGNSEIFLTEDEVDLSERAANQGVIVNEIPKSR